MAQKVRGLRSPRLMRGQDIGDVLIAEEGRLHGVLTDRDIAVVRCPASRQLSKSPDT
ncbi:hypothetical protein [Actinospica sp.]|uniref:hypothetical protein n=1 Tax=Actinospica sp. TaxID=1872142 RepID=UPI002C3E5A71|nr:hypothetical protein [Actinospica sp.]HWG23772.1 hypothetical protein [Actinospica sp.]